MTYGQYIRCPRNPLKNSIPDGQYNVFEGTEYSAREAKLAN